ncbi:methionyl-tRNA formyltransferase [Desulfovibrio aminophilus]|uniref:methionyl-tRNA formyltransferase n=1 Tax=Desulfovibrio aminophilus TaxID=81425 RepID=UPI0033946093
MGTPDFAAVILKHLLAWEGGEVLAVYTQPDRPCGRGLSCKPSPVKALALEYGLDVRQPLNFKDPAEVEALRALEPDVLAVAAYGLILSQAVLDVPKLMPVNVHASLLPKYRGAAPIQRCILDGETVTGISIMRMEKGLDSGPILLQRALRMGGDEHAGQVHDQLAEMGGLLLVEALERLRDGRLAVVPQDDSLATYAPKLSKDEGRIDWNRPAQEIHDRARAMHPWPGAFFQWSPDGKKHLRLTLTPGKIGPEPERKAEPGTILGEMDGHIAIQTADRVYLTPSVQPEGRKALSASAFACGYLKTNC